MKKKKGGRGRTKRKKLKEKEMKLIHEEHCVETLGFNSVFLK